MTRTVVIAIASSLLMFGCGSDSGTSAPTSTDATTTSTDATATSTDATTTSTETPPETAADTVAGDASDVPSALTPKAVCVGANGEVFFGYDNASAEVVVVEEGDANQLTGAAAGDNPLLTTLFAPGQVDAAFWAYADGPNDITWTLTGPDGVERTASGGSSTQACATDFPAVVDDRVPEVQVVGQTLAADGESVEVELRLAGVDETSICNEAFDAEPVLVSISDGSSLPTGFEPDATVTAGPFFDAMNGRLATTMVYALVVDQCSGAGVTAASWSPAPAVSSLTFGTVVCARLDDAGALTVELKTSPCDLPATGGLSIRPR